jgi:hypothetical protein
VPHTHKLDCWLAQAAGEVAVNEPLLLSAPTQAPAASRYSYQHYVLLFVYHSRCCCKHPAAAAAAGMP